MAQGKSTKIEKISVVDQVGDEIKEKIISGEWKPGDKLPSEAEIAAMYGVNRLSVRMALQKLITLGIVETRVGEGSFVKDFSFYPVLSQMADFIGYSDRMDDIREMRYMLERACALKAAETCTQEEAVELTEVLEEYCKFFDISANALTEEGIRDNVEADLALHSQIVKMSGNRLYLEIYKMIRKLILLDITSLVEQRRSAQPGSAEIYKEMHIKLCEAIISHNREAVKQVLSPLLDVTLADEYVIG